MIPMPAIWWQDADRWPSTIRYLPTARISPCLIGDEKKDLEAFLRLVPIVLNRALAENNVIDISFEPILYGEQSMNDLTTAGHPWLVATLPMHQQGIPMPEWVLDKEAELANRAMQRQSAKLKKGS
jgi:hypothetical protein